MVFLTAVAARISALLAWAAVPILLCSCGGSSGAPGLPAAASNTGGGQGEASPAAGSGHCSDPNPSNLALTFAAIVCVQGQSTVPQSDGSTELKFVIRVTDKDPNAFDVTTTDFKLLDTVGHDIAVDPAANPSAGRAGSSDCIYQESTDSGFPLSPGKSLTVPGPICFNLQAGEHPRELVWQDDVSVKVG